MKLLVAVLCILAADARADDASIRAERQLLEAERSRLEAERAAKRAAELAAAAAKRAAERAAAGKLEKKACPAEQHVVRTVDLDRPGAFAELKESNPAHFARVLAIQETRPRPLQETWTWAHTHARACDVTMLNFYRTSLPAQARLSFVLDDTRYTRTVYVGQGR